MTDEEIKIRANERAKCVSEISEYARAYVDRWGPIVGWDDAKATAWSITVAARRLMEITETPQKR